ncbi:aldose 1-epimerase [Alkalispirochaeta americana]|uniref:Aldose 1-epimerase n=1 Tax=Alkalispirochaeta americana TaxID=159291 RepID=A0A1N6SEY9_9SPIO|nr:aldose epimerase family protein [Alkalispirochaeta americana]SIQ39522.1 aldose 1-epimerase [Alkalispirochaeta americana]
MNVSITESDFGRLPDGRAVSLFTLRNAAGMSVSLSSWGALVTSVTAPDRLGRSGEITLARNTLEEYLEGHPYYGALVGRVCNRISSGGFSLEGIRHNLPSNLGKIHLHGGIRGFDKHLYETGTVQDESWSKVIFRRLSPSGEEGYPGNLEVCHTITLTEDNQLVFDFEAETDAPTVVNMTNHCYWNLSGEPAIMDHEVQVMAEAIMEVDENYIPTGRLLPLEGTAFDLNHPRTVRQGFQELQTAGIKGYDHSLAIRGWNPGEPLLRKAAVLRAPATGRAMEIATTYPAVHVYSGNNLTGETGRAGETLSGQEAICFECQFFPDSPNRPEFPPITLVPGERYRHQTVHRFSTFS